MLHRTFLTELRIIVVCCICNTFASPAASSQAQPSQGDHPFQELFAELAATRDVPGRRAETTYIQLMESIKTLTPAQVSEGILVIDHQLDNTDLPEDRLAKAHAAYLLTLICTRPDGPRLMESQFGRLTSMLNDPAHFLTGPAAMALEYIAVNRPAVVIPILEVALRAPEVNNKTGIGPGISTLLLRIAPPTNEVTESLVEYMRRSDLTDEQLIDTIIGINSSPVVPDAIVAELVRSLDRRNEVVKGRALQGIGRGSPAAIAAARPLIQRMADDPTETPHTRQLAKEALTGLITENPDVKR